MAAICSKYPQEILTEGPFKALTGRSFCIQTEIHKSIHPAPFYLSVNKAGSTLQTGVVETICKASGISFLNLADQLFLQGLSISECPLQLLNLLERELVSTGFREPWLLLHVQRYWSSPKILLVRDPRDIAVSLYFSITSSHAMPAEGHLSRMLNTQRQLTKNLTISQFVTAGEADSAIMNMRNFLQHSYQVGDFRIRRYEDVIFSKRQWFKSIADELQVDFEQQLLEELIDRFDVFPKYENPHAHIRRVTPGDYQRRLDSVALDYLEQRFKDVFEELDYTIKKRRHRWPYFPSVLRRRGN